MADLRSRFIEDYAGGLLNVSRQELASNGEVLSQDGFLTDLTSFVEDGTGTKSGLKLGVGLAEVVDPTTQTGIVNVRYADRTFTKIRDTKIFATAIASAQAALAESVTESLTNIESAIDFLELGATQTDGRVSNLETGFSTLTSSFADQESTFNEFRSQLQDELRNLSLGTDSDTNNIKIGVGALGKIENGASNVGIGYYSLGELINGNDNICIGGKAGNDLIEGSNNILIGSGARLSNPRANDQIVLGGIKNNFLWCKTDIYTPAVTLGSNDSSSNSITSSGFFKFVQSLEFKKVNWERGQSYIVIEPESLKRAEESLGFKGYLHAESSSVSNAKLVPLMLQTLSGLFEILGINFSPEALETSGGSSGGGGGSSGDNSSNPLGEDIGGGVTPTFDGGGSNISEQTNEPGDGNALNSDFVPDGTDTLTVEFASGKSIKDLLKNEDPLEKFRRNFFPIGGIIMWSNFGSQPVPDGWALCDGTNGTPDLREKFIIGAGSPMFPVGASKDDPPEVPKHTHPAKGEVEWVEKIVKVTAPSSDTEPMVPDPFGDTIVSVPALVGDAAPATNPLIEISSLLAAVPEEVGSGLTRCTVTTYESLCPGDDELERKEPVAVTVEEFGEEPPLTYPPYFALAFIMRIY